MGDARTPSDLEALERFVVDNDELLELEARIGRFNIFDALGIVNNEIRHSNFLAWLLDPGESHGLGPLFLNAVLMDLLRQTPVKDRLFSPIKLDGGELRGVQVRREWNRIDLLITCHDPSFVIAIENKVYSGEHSNQLARYKKIVNETPELAKHAHRQFVYLTRKGDEPSEDDWTIYSYKQLYKALKRVTDTSGDQMGDDVRAFLNHYLHMIGSRLMDDEKIDELCETIYKNHRQAIDRIVEHVGQWKTRVLNPIADELASRSDYWTVVLHRGRHLGFAPNALLEMLPAIGTWPNRASPKHWIGYWFEVTESECMLYGLVDPIPDEDLRCSCVALLDNKTFGMTLPDKTRRGLAKGVLPQWPLLRIANVATWNGSELPDFDALQDAAVAHIDRLSESSRTVTDALRPIIAQWQRDHPA